MTQQRKATRQHQQRATHQLIVFPIAAAARTITLRVALVAAKSFVARMLKRRPSVHPSWRMCPST